MPEKQTPTDKDIVGKRTGLTCLSYRELPPVEGEFPEGAGRVALCCVKITTKGDPRAFIKYPYTLDDGCICCCECCAA
jgi:hypothetical protein